MHSDWFHVGPLTVHWYGVMMALGFLAALANWSWLGRRSGRGFNYCSDLLFWVMVCGVIGARAAYVALEWPSYRQDPMAILRIDQGGLVFYGGFLFAGLSLALFARLHRESFVDLLDFVITSVPLAHAFGRVGCFLNGCCYGMVCHGPMGVQFPRGSPPWYGHYTRGLVAPDAPLSLPVHPVQLYEAAFNLAFYGLLLWQYRGRRRVGSTAALYLVVYAAGRFVLELVRDDERGSVGWFSTSQLVSLGLLALGLGVGLWSRKAGEACASRQTSPTQANGSTAG